MLFDWLFFGFKHLLSFLLKLAIERAALFFGLFYPKFKRLNDKGVLIAFRWLAFAVGLVKVEQFHFFELANVGANGARLDADQFGQRVLTGEDIALRIPIARNRGISIKTSF